MTQTLIWRATDSGLVPILKDGREETSVAWAPQPGSQVAFLSCPVYECLYEGTRGPGKSDALLMDYLQHVNQGWGPEWRGILFRRTYPELQDVIDKSLKWFPKILPGAQYNRGQHFWSFPNGEQLFFRHFLKPQDYWSYHGHAYPWIAWEELTTWPDPSCYTSMFSCSRSTVPGMPRKIRSTTNPYGIGHNWVKKRWRLPITMGRVAGPVIRDAIGRDGKPDPERVAVHGDIEENMILLHADPDYIRRIVAAARNPAQLKAWRYGDWNIVAGGMFDDVWDPSIHVLSNFPPSKIPRAWRITRSYDHGQSAPFSVGWWAESNGEPFVYEGRVYGPIRGDVIRIAEWYGCDPNEENTGIRMLAGDIAEGILDREEDYGIKGRVRIGPADTQIFDEYEPNKSVAGDMKKRGVRWDKADKGPGSRKQGWEQIRTLLKRAAAGPREEPGLFVLERCRDFQRTVPVLPRDEKDMDDVDSDSEDHIGDETRYRLRHKERAVYSGDYK